jgi:hypothetical protein
MAKRLIVPPFAAGLELENELEYNSPVAMLPPVAKRLITPPIASFVGMKTASDS